MTPVQERAGRAVRAFDQMLPALNSFARALTGRSLMRVKMGTTTATDGQVIEVSPPIQLGDEIEHNRPACGKRGEDGNMICSACASREFILSMTYHEISHLCFGSFEEFDFNRFRTLARKYFDDNEKLTKRLDKGIISCQRRYKVSSLELAAIINPFLPTLLRATEDIRVDSRMIDARAGTAAMRRAVHVDIANKGFTSLDGSVLRWSELPPNAQLTVAMIPTASGTDLLYAYDPYVAAVVTTPEMLDVLAEAVAAPDQVTALIVAIKAMIVGQKYGFFLSDIDDENFLPEDSDTDDKSDGEDDDAKGDENPDEEGKGSKDESESTDSGEANSEDGEGESSDVSTEADEAEGVQSEGGGEDSSAADELDGDDADAGGDSVEPGGESPSDGESDGDGESDVLESSPSEDGSDGEGDSKPGEGEESSADEGSSDAGVHDSAPGDGDADSESGGGGSSDSDDGEGIGEGSEASPGEHGDRVQPLPAKPDVDFGTPSESAAAVDAAVGHKDEIEDTTRPGIGSSKGELKAINDAINYFENFDTPSDRLTGVRVVTEVEKSYGVRDEVERLRSTVTEKVLGPNLLKMRRAFADNARADQQRNRRSGRVDARVLGRRAWSNDDRLFSKKTIPGKKDYAILIGIDLSGSTSRHVRRTSLTIADLEVQAAFAQAELCARIGVKFAVYGHSGTESKLKIFEVKHFDAPWDSKAIKKMSRLAAHRANLDGHTLEWYRKRLDEVRAMHKVLMYYSDGAMPAENYREELELLHREIDICRKRGYILLAVGALSNDTEKYGMDTVRLDQLADVSKVVAHLGSRIADL